MWQNLGVSFSGRVFRYIITYFFILVLIGTGIGFICALKYAQVKSTNELEKNPK